MIYTSTSIDAWQDAKAVIVEFLESDYDYLFLPENDSISIKHFGVSYVYNPDVDLVQFATLRLWQRGELGIRESYWKFLEVFTASRIISLSIQLLSVSKSPYVSHIVRRYKSMQLRRLAIRRISKDFSRFGVVIPHYIEPISSTLFISKNFARALLELNVNNDLSLQRAFFSLARTANFDCVRISGFSGGS